MQRASSITAGASTLAARDVRVPAFQAVRVLRGDPPAAPGRHPDHQRHGELAARHVRDRGGVVDDLVERQAG